VTLEDRVGAVGGDRSGRRNALADREQ